MLPKTPMRRAARAGQPEDEPDDDSESYCHHCASKLMTSESSVGKAASALLSRRSVRTQLSLAALALIALTASALGADWEGYQRLSRDELLATLAGSRQGSRPQIYAKNLSNVDLSGVDFRGANLSASVFNGAKLMRARLDDCNLTVSFLERADLTGATLRNATLFSVQLAGGNLTDANLSGARLIGDLRNTDLSRANLTRMNAAADMKNQSMGLMRTSIVNAKAI